MIALPRRRQLTAAFAPMAAAAVAVAAALVVALIPSALLETFALQSGIAAVLPAAEPPLGWTARAVMMLAGGGGLGILAWTILSLLIDPAAKHAAIGEPNAVPVLRRADAHPDAPSRRPVFANEDLGTPFLDVRAAAPPASADVDPVAAPVVERAIPTDLDEPLAAYDPAAIRGEPAEPVRVAGRPQIFGPGERFETFELTPLVRPAARESVLRYVPQAEPGLGIAPETTASIHTLLDRLERGVARRDPPAPAEMQGDAVEAALVTLRRLATGG